MRLTAIVPATNDPPTLARCLDAIRVADDPPREVIVVREPAGLGPAGARNEGAEAATGEVLVFVDSDVLVHRNAFTRVRTSFAADPQLVAVFGSYDDRVLTRGVVGGFRNLLHHVVHQRSAGEVRSFWAGLGAVRSSAFDACGGFDAARYAQPSIEDIELGGRLAQRGRILLDPTLLGTHLKEWSLASMVRTDYARRGVPWVQLMLENGEVPATLNLGARERASVLLSLLAVTSLVVRRPTLAVGAITAQVTLNADLYGLLARKLGARGAAAGVALHTLHHLTAAAAVPAALVTYALNGRRA